MLRRQKVSSLTLGSLFGVRYNGTSSKTMGDGLSSLPQESAVEWYSKTWARMTDPSSMSEGRLLKNGGQTQDVDLVEIRRKLQVFTGSSNHTASGGQGLLPLEVSQHLWLSYNGLTASKDRQGQVAFLCLLVDVGVDVNALRSCLTTLAATVGGHIEAAKEEEELVAADSLVEMSKLLSQLDRARTTMSSLHAKWLHETSAMPNGTQLLLDFRHSLLDLEAWAKKSKAKDGESLISAQDLKKVQAVLSTTTMQLREWFGVAWLDMRPLSWHSTSPAVIEEVMRHDVVHSMQHGQLRHALYRMAPTPLRQMFAFFHPTIPYMPLVTVQVALTKGISGSVDDILYQERRETMQEANGKLRYEGGTAGAEVSNPDTAIFYSINATQEGLRGIDLGKFLIQKVVHSFQTEHAGKEGAATGGSSPPTITTFSTLSPIPNYVSWLEGLLLNVELSKRSRTAAAPSLMEQRATLEQAFLGDHITAVASARTILKCLLGGDASPSPRRELKGRDDDGEEDVATLSAALAALVKVAKNPPAGFTETLRAQGQQHPLVEVLTQSAAKYLAAAKRRGRILDPVGNFHCKNGATIYRVNWAGNCTANGCRQSLCMMVNYLYEVTPRSTSSSTTVAESNAASYEMTGTVALGQPLQSLLQVKD